MFDLSRSFVYYFISSLIIISLESQDEHLYYKHLYHLLLRILQGETTRWYSAKVNNNSLCYCIKKI